MKKYLNIFVVVISIFVLATGCMMMSHSSHNMGMSMPGSDMKDLPAAGNQKNLQVYYTCSMHPEVHSDKPGKCPKCGMNLVKKEMAMPDSTLAQHSK